VAAGPCGVEGGVAAIVDPSHVQGVTRVGEIDDGQIEQEVREAAAGLRVALDDVLESLDDGGAAELNVSFDEVAPASADGDGSV
jgi:hypothetical protein